MINDKKDFWKRKLMAYLHDPPHKSLDIGRHEEGAKSLCFGAGITELDYDTFKKMKEADHMASASDRFPFPKGKCASKFTGKLGETFKHPLNGSEYEFECPTWELADEILKNAIGGIKSNSENDEEKWKQIFFLYWRRWLDEVVKIKEYGSVARHFAYFPADTRIPDHTIWSHMAITSALEGCRNEAGKIKPSFILFNLGPVQEFIAQARSTRDLWSGSYMLSWLTAHAMKAVSDYNGPDSVVFPSLSGQGIFDVLYQDELYSKITYKGLYKDEDTLWERMYKSGTEEEKVKLAEKLLNPTLPNRFLAVVPEHKANEIAQAAMDAVINELKEISEYVWKQFKKYTETLEVKTNYDDWKRRWDKQVEMLPQISWQILPWYDNIDEAMEQFQKLPINRDKDAETAYNNLFKLNKFITETIPKEDRDGRYYTNSDKTKLNNIGFVWPVHYAICDYALSARRNTRNFQQYVTDENQFDTRKDSLSGKEEVIGSEDLWEAISAKGDLFKNNEGPYGAVNIIKRLWCKNIFVSNDDKPDGYLLKKLKIKESIFKKAVKFDSVPDIACKNEESFKIKDGEKIPKNPYIAVIALDGDEMGKWVSGEKIPKLTTMIGTKAKTYFEKLGFDENLKRPLTPSYHLQFSKELYNSNIFIL